jgi:hypothetical protein
MQSISLNVNLTNVVAPYLEVKVDSFFFQILEQILQSHFGVN